MRCLAICADTCRRWELRLTITVKNSDKKPLGRWLASVVIPVEDVEKKEIKASRDVIIVGGASPDMGPLDFDIGFGTVASGWKSLPLQPDRNFNRRLANACPAIADWTPPVSSSGLNWPIGATAQGSVCIQDQHTGVACVIAVVCGTSASIGRGGDPAVAWWLQPVPYDAHQHARLSGGTPLWTSKTAALG